MGNGLYGRREVRCVRHTRRIRAHDREQRPEPAVTGSNTDSPRGFFFLFPPGILCEETGGKRSEVVVFTPQPAWRGLAWCGACIVSDTHHLSLWSPCVLWVPDTPARTVYGYSGPWLIVDSLHIAPRSTPRSTPRHAPPRPASGHCDDTINNNQPLPP